MISINLFKTDGRFARGMCNTKIIYSVIRYGAKGIAKVSPVLVCVDVVLSLADMIPILMANIVPLKSKPNN
ncbi:hypothetical protein KVC24_02610 [Helicobacter pylori]|nr:hypothetical protein KVC24_02610 [Helicobacter pylori]